MGLSLTRARARARLMIPRPDVREQIPRLPAPGQVSVEAVSQPSPPPPETAGFATNSALTSVPARALGAPSRPRGRELEPLSAARFGVHFTADAELRELIDRARALASHRIPNGDLLA